MPNGITARGSTVTIQGSVSQDTPLSYKGDDGNTKTVTVPQGKSFAKDLAACEAVRLVNAALAAGFRISGDQDTHDNLEFQSRDCPTDKIEWPAEPAKPLPDPSSTGNDKPPPSGEPSPEELDAPAVETSIFVSQTPIPSGQSDGRPLAEQYYDPRQPMSDYDVVSNLTIEGVPPDKLDEELQRVIHNEPPPKQRHPTFGQDDRQDPNIVADPVIIFTGQYNLSSIDVQIPSRGFPLHLTRIYRSGLVYFGPWGYNWDHNYNVYLRELSDGDIAIWTGNLSEDVYRPNPDGSFEPPVGIFLKLERQAATPLRPDRYVLTDREETQQIFERPTGWPRPDRIPLVSIEDRHGNAHQLSYDAEGRLERVADHASRFLRFIYGDCDLLEQVTDHTGRIWRYFHDADVEHLIAVTTPVTPEYPEGLTTCYEYDRFRTHPALIHNLTRVIDPAGRVVVENQYGDDPGTDDFARVVYQEFGGFEAILHATRLQYVPRIPDAINVPALRVEVVDPGVLHAYTFNYRGDLLDERYRLSVDGSYRLSAHTFRYDSQGNRVEERRPNGLGILLTYDHMNSDPCARQNLLSVHLVAPPTRPAPSREIARYTYEPRYHQVKTFRNEANDVTTLIYDYEEMTTNRGDVIRVEYSPVTLPDGTQQLIREHFSYNAFGQLTEFRSGEGNRYGYDYYGSGLAEGYLRRSTAGLGAENVTTELRYDQYGYISSSVAPTGAITEYEYNALGQLVRVRKPDVNGARGDTVYHYAPHGHLARIETPRGTYQDGVITDPSIIHEFDYDVLGHLRSTVYGVNTATPQRWHYSISAEGDPVEIVDPIGHVTRIVYDERFLPLRQVQSPGTPEERTLRYQYDRNGNLLRFIDTAGRVTTFDYDSWDRLKETRSPGTPNARAVFHYDLEDRIGKIEVSGPPRPGQLPTVLTAVEREYDALGRQMRETHAGLSYTTWYDRDSRAVRHVDPRGNAVTVVYDALGRLTHLTDPLNNRLDCTYDIATRTVTIDSLETVPGAPVREHYRTTLHYDIRNRLSSVVDPLGNKTITEYDDRDRPIAAITALGDRHEYEYDVDGALALARSYVGSPPHPVVHRWKRDSLGRFLAYIDPAGHETRYEYGANPEWTKLTFANGRTFQRIFDKAGQLHQEITPVGVQVTYTYDSTGAVERVQHTSPSAIQAVSDLVIERDGLGRPTSITQGGESVELEYDALGRLIAETADGATTRWTYDDLNGTSDLTYPNGRVDRYLLDALGRIKEILYAQPGISPLPSLTLAPGARIAQYEYVGPERLHRRLLGNGCSTEYSYDLGRRLTGILHRAPDGDRLAEAQYLYDALSRRRVVRLEPAPGNGVLYEYDPLLRLTHAREGVHVPPIPSRLSQADADAYYATLGVPAALRTHIYTVDDADAVEKVTVTDASGTYIDDYTLNSVHEVQQRTRTTSAGVSTSPFTFDTSGYRTHDDRHTYVYDALGRLREVRDLAGTTIIYRQAYDPLGRVVIRQLNTSPPERIHHFGPRAVQDDRADGTPLRQRTFGIKSDELVLQSQGQNRWSHQDARLSLLLVTNDTGAPEERYNYSPYGKPSMWAPDGVTPRLVSSGGIPPLFGGHRWLEPAGLYDSRARMYDPDTGLFLQRDPQGFSAGPNPYAYTNLNPINFVDPKGEFVVAIPIVVAVIAGAVLAAGATVYDSSQHPERYEGWNILKGFTNTVLGGATGGALVAIPGLVAASGEVAAGGSLLGGLGLAGTGTVGLLDALFFSATVNAEQGLLLRNAGSIIFPDSVNPPTPQTVGEDYAFGAALGTVGWALEALIAIGPRNLGRYLNLLVQEAENQIELKNLTLQQSRVTSIQRAAGPRGAALKDTQNQLFSKLQNVRGTLAELRVARLHIRSLEAYGRVVRLTYKNPKTGETRTVDTDLDVETAGAWHEVKTGSFTEEQLYARIQNVPSGKRVLYWLNPAFRSQRNQVITLTKMGLPRENIMTLGPALRGEMSLSPELPFRGLSGAKASVVPWGWIGLVGK